MFYCVFLKSELEHAVSSYTFNSVRASKEGILKSAISFGYACSLFRRLFIIDYPSPSQMITLMNLITDNLSPKVKLIREAI